MIYLCYLIVCINLQYYFDQVETFSHAQSRDVWRHKQDLHLNLITVENQNEILAKSVSPFWNVPYDEELIQKQSHCNSILEKIVKLIDSLEISMTYRLLPIVPSPITKAYRSRDTFSVWRGVDGNVKTVGLVVRDSSLGLTYAIRPTKISTIKESHKKVAQVYEDFIRLSPLPPHFDSIGVGHWRHLIVRSNKAGHIIATVTVQPTNYTNEMIYKEREKLKLYFQAHLPNITLYHQQCSLEPFTRCTRVLAPYFLLNGKPYFVDTLNGYKFKILPDSSFHINSLGAEVFYETIIKTAELTPNTSVLDIFSAAGVFSIMASKFVKESIGIEANKYTNKNAIYNARLNKIDNVNFLFGYQTKILYGLVGRLQGSSDILAMVYPGSRGAGLDLINEIRRASGITRVVYIARKPDSPKFIRDIITLCSNKTSRFPPFTLTKVIPFDPLPRTANVDLIYMFKRHI